MSRFASKKINLIDPYVPGEQPKDVKYIKLNTNENPCYTSGRAVNAISKDKLSRLNRYSDPESIVLCNEIAELYGVKPENVMVTNGSDEALAFAFLAYGATGVCYPDVTYGFYDVIANLFGCKIKHIPLESDFTVSPEKYYNAGGMVVLANPNAQTGMSVTEQALESIIKNNTENIVLVDQAYADFNSYNAIKHIAKYKNLLTVNTFSKSRSLAGARVGYVIADKEIIEDLKKVKNSFHPYNVNSISAILAAEAIKDKDYFMQSVNNVIAGRNKLTKGLLDLDFVVLPSSANFVLAKTEKIDGEKLYKLLKENGVLVRHLKDERINKFIRITVGTEKEIDEFLNILKRILSEI